MKQVRNPEKSTFTSILPTISMTENRKIARVLQLIIRLRSPLGCEKTETAALFDVTVRTIERHIKLLRELGFRIEQQGGRYRIISSNQSKFLHEELIAFSLEEAQLLREALLHHRMSGPMERQLLDKLYALTEMEELADSMTNLERSRTIALIRRAIRDKKQVMLVDYESANSHSTRSRIVEPQRFLDYFRYLLAYEPETGQSKTFKTDRIGEVKVMSRSWKHADKHQRMGMDAFGLTGIHPVTVRLHLSQRARQLLCEEFPDAASGIETKGKTNVFVGQVYGFEGIGRFVTGLLGEVEVIEPQTFKDYIKEKIKKYCQ